MTPFIFILLLTIIMILVMYAIVIFTEKRLSATPPRIIAVPLSFITPKERAPRWHDLLVLLELIMAIFVMVFVLPRLFVAYATYTPDYLHNYLLYGENVSEFVVFQAHFAEVNLQSIFNITPVTLTFYTLLACAIAFASTIIGSASPFGFPCRMVWLIVLLGSVIHHHANNPAGVARKLLADYDFYALPVDIDEQKVLDLKGGCDSEILIFRWHYIECAESGHSLYTSPSTASEIIGIPRTQAVIWIRDAKGNPKTFLAIMKGTSKPAGGIAEYALYVTNAANQMLTRAMVNAYVSSSTKEESDSWSEARHP